MKHFLLVISFLLCQLGVYSQVANAIHKVDLPKGLMVFCNATDGSGKMWIGLGDGLSSGAVAYLSNDFTLKQFSLSNLGVTGSVATAAKERGGSVIMAGNLVLDQGYPCIVRTLPDSIEIVPLPLKSSSLVVNSIAVLKDNDIWLSTSKGLLVNSAANGWQYYGTGEGLPSSYVNMVVQDFRGLIWVATTAGVVAFDSNRVIQPTGQVVTSVDILYQDRIGYLWAGSSLDAGGLSVFNGELWQTFSASDGLVSNSTSNLYSDTKQQLWVSSCLSQQTGGLSMFDGKEWIAFTFPKHLSKPCIDNIVEDKEGNIWFSGPLDISTGGGLSVLSSGSWIDIGDDTYFPANQVVHMFLFSNRLCISAKEGFYCIKTTEVLNYYKRKGY